jgi:hypothetical protein
MVLLMVVSLAAGAQTPDSTAQQPATQPAPSASGARPATTPDPAQQMQLDLDQMESLVNNMAAQVSFIRDTNMSILLNTNVRLWTVLIRDLRMQLEQQRGARQEKSSSPPRH